MAGDTFSVRKLVYCRTIVSLDTPTAHACGSPPDPPGISGERFATALIAGLSARDGMTLKFSLWPVAGQDVVIRARSSREPTSPPARYSTTTSHIDREPLSSVEHQLGAAEHRLHIKIWPSCHGSTTRVCL